MFGPKAMPLNLRYRNSRVSVRAVVSALPLLISFLAAFNSIAAQTNTDPVVLESGPGIERELAGGQTHRYQVNLTAGQFAHLSVEQKGIDVVVKLFAPDGVLVTEVDSPNGKMGPEPVRLVVEVTGVYRLEISSLESGAPAARYEAKVVQLRAAVPKDRDLLAARRAFDDGATLHAQRTRDSLSTALGKYEESLTLYRRAGDQVGEISVLINFAAAYRLLGEPQKAVEKADSAQKLARLAGEKRWEAQALTVAAAAYRNLGDYEQALRTSLEALGLYQTVADRDNERVMLKSVGEVYSFLGEQDTARIFFENAITLFRAQGNKAGEAGTLHSIGYSYVLQEDWPRALEYYRRSLALWLMTADRAQQAIEQSFVALESARASLRAEAIEHATEALMLRRPVGDFNEATVLTNVGNAYAKISEYDQAQGHFNAALVIWRAIGDRRGEAITLRHISFALRDQGRLADARAQAEQGISLLELMRDHAGTPEMQASFVATLFDIYDIYIDVLMRLHGADPKAGHDRAALAFSEKVKLRSLKELLTKGRVDLRAGADSALLERERNVNARITASLDALSKLLRGKFTSEQRAAAEQELNALQAERRQVQDELRRRSPRYSALTEPQQLDASEIQRQVLDENTLMLEFSLGRDRSYLWTVTASEVKSYSLPPRAVVEAQAVKIYRLLTARQPVRGVTASRQRDREAVADRELRTESVKLSTMLLGPAAAQLGTKRLLVVADGALQYLPFAVLPAPAPPGVDHSLEPRPLIVDHEIVTLPSASIVAVLRREFADRAPAALPVAVLADPVYQADDARVKPGGIPPTRAVGLGQRDSSGTELRRLMFSRDEADAIIAATPERSGMQAVGFRANRRLAMSDELGQYRILHFSTHGLLDSRRPELSGLVLSLVDEKGAAQEGFLRLHEIYNLRLSAELVVLSACQTALGRDVRGEGLIGLTRGFMYAGSLRVVASLWEVDDAATTELMKRFYRGLLQQRLPAATALRAAQLEMLQKKHWQSPYYWGAFVLQGEWR